MEYLYASGCISKNFSRIICHFIELKAFSKSLFTITFSLGRSLLGLSIRTETFGANSALLLVLAPTCRLPYLAWRDSKTWYLVDIRGKVWPTAIRQSPQSSCFVQLTLHHKNTVKVRIRRITFTRIGKANLPVRLRRQSFQFQSLWRNAIQTCTRAAREGHESLGYDELRS